MMEWKNLLSDKRFRERSKRDPLDARNPFEDDFSRIVFSSAFRRLQDKTQVFPLERDSLVRTRLTHSMEVSNIGRSIGLSVERKLVKDAKLSEEHRGHIPSILAVAGLVHDLGNPPWSLRRRGVQKILWVQTGSTEGIGAFRRATKRSHLFRRQCSDFSVSDQTPLFEG